MKKFLHAFAAGCLLFCLCCAPGLYAQKKNVRDSLFREAANPATSDTAKALVLAGLGDYYRFINPDSAQIVLEQGIALSRKINFPKGLGYAFNIKGLLSKDKSKTEEAIGFFDQSISFFNSTGDSIRAANIYNNKGLVYYDAGNITKANSNFEHALRIYLPAKNLKGAGITYINFGQINRKNGLYFTALDYYFKALDIFEHNDISREQLANTYGNIGTVYNHLEKYGEAITFQKKALAIFEELDLRLKANIVKTNIASQYYETGDLASAEKSAEEAIVFFKDNKRTRIVVANQFTLISIAIKRGEFDKGLKIAAEIEDAMKNIRDPEIEATELNHKAELYFLKHEYRQAQLFGEKAYQVSKSNQILQLQKDAAKTLADIFNARGDYKNAFHYLVVHSGLKDSTFNKGKLNQLFELEKKYEVDKKQSEVNLLESKNKIAELQLAEEKRSRLQLIGGIAVLMALLGVIYNGYRTKSRLNSRLAQQNEEITAQNELIDSINKELQARALRAQMNPHFIFNSLNSIQYLVLKNSSEHAFDYLSQFATLLRQVMDNSEKNWISLTEDAEILKLYLALESLRFSNSFQYSIVLPPDPGSIKIPPLLVQPFVENAILHGLLPKPGDRRLTITFTVSANQLVCEVEDNGIGRAAAAKIAGAKNQVFGSKGMNYTTQRMKVLNAVHGTHSGIEIVDLAEGGMPSGTLVRITVTQP